MLVISPKKLFSLRRYLSFRSDYFVSIGKRLDKKAKINFRIYDVANWETIRIHILPNISRSTGNRTIKFCQLTEYNMRYIFLEKLYTKHGGETSPRPFFKKLSLSIYLDQ